MVGPVFVCERKCWEGQTLINGKWANPDEHLIRFCLNWCHWLFSMVSCC